MNVYVLETARRLAARGVEVDVFTRRHDPADEQVTALSPAARVVHLDAGPPEPLKEGVYNLLPDFSARLADFTSSNGSAYDIVTSHYWLSGLVGGHLRRAWGVPHVTSFHTLAEVKRRARPGEVEVPQRAGAERQIACGADTVVAWTPHEREAIASYYGADTARIAVIPPGVDTTVFRPLEQAASRRKLGLGPGRLLLYVGRLERLKGVDILLRAFAQLEHPEGVRLLIVGGGSNSPELDRLRSIASGLGTSDRVSFFGSVAHEDLPAYYSAADICVLPSYYESFGLAALEAAACGRPVVASKVGGLPTVVLDGRTGYLVAWQCPGPFVSRLELLLANDRLRREMGESARRHAESLTWDHAAESLLALFEGLASRAASQAPRASQLAVAEGCVAVGG
jgi:D-inositol-3-phosphate glycosyltransferase